MMMRRVLALLALIYGNFIETGFLNADLGGYFTASDDERKSVIVIIDSGYSDGVFKGGSDFLPVPSESDAEGQGIGWDLYDSDVFPNDVLGHGTKVAETLLKAAGEDGNRRLFIVKAGERSFTPDAVKQGLDLVAELISAGWQVKMVVCAISLEVPHSLRKPLEESLQRLLDAHVKIVSAAGNEGLDLSSRTATYRFPASILHPGHLVVAASGLDGHLTGYSNWGTSHVRFAVAIPSDKALTEGIRGTSWATAYAAGALLEANLDETRLSLNKHVSLLTRVSRGAFLLSSQNDVTK